MNLPKEISELIDNDSLSMIYTGQSNMDVFRVALIDGRYGYLKTSNADSDKREIEHEIKVLSWLEYKLVVPKPLMFKVEQDNFYFLMSELPGQNLADICDEIGSRLCMALAARFMRKIHSTNISNCPFDRDLDRTLQLAHRNLMNGLVDESDFDKERLGRSGQALFRELENNVPLEQDLVFTHGDYCFPNIIFLKDDIGGVIDLGRAGISDRYQDIALFLRSFEFNIGKPNVDLFIREYGLIDKIDYEKVKFYTLLDEFF
jgi:aminoglycoside phosphotransferase